MHLDPMSIRASNDRQARPICSQDNPQVDGALRDDDALLGGKANLSMAEMVCAAPFRLVNKVSPIQDEGDLILGHCALGASTLGVFAGFDHGDLLGVGGEKAQEMPV